LCPNKTTTYTDPKVRWQQWGVAYVILIDDWMLEDEGPRRGHVEKSVGIQEQGFLGVRMP